MTNYEKVRQFRLAFGQVNPAKPEIPDQQGIHTCWKLINEELGELGTADSTLDAFDAVLDLFYVVYGAAIAYGFSEAQIHKGFHEVHRSNMTKFWNMAEIDSEHFLQGYAYKRANCEKACYVVTDPSGKIIKSPSYSPANLGPILEGKG